MSHQPRCTEDDVFFCTETYTTYRKLRGEQSASDESHKRQLEYIKKTGEAELEYAFNNPMCRRHR